MLDLARDDAPERLAKLMGEHAVDSVIHFAARKQVGESVARPAYYYQSNLGGMANLLTAMEAPGWRGWCSPRPRRRTGCRTSISYARTRPCAPINPYGETKLVGEWLARAAARAWGLRVANLRYFNVAGAGWDDLGDPAILNLVPMVFDRLERGEAPRVFGDDYPTPDGTCIRDYVHVLDLADAHLAALDYLGRDERPYDTFNVGTGSGASVREVIDEVGRATGLDVTPRVEPRRAGDPPRLVADVSRIHDELDWTAPNGLPEIVGSAWSAWRPAPDRLSFGRWTGGSSGRGSSRRSRHGCRERARCPRQRARRHRSHSRRRLVRAPDDSADADHGVEDDRAGTDDGTVLQDGSVDNGAFLNDRPRADDRAAADVG